MTRISTAAAIAALALAAGTATSASAQSVVLPDIPSSTVEIAFDSGEIASTGRTEIAFSDAVVVRDASWLRLFFGEVTLGETDEGETATLKVTSMLDGHVQYFDRQALANWRNSSAVFNGDGVIIEVIQPAGASPSHVTVLTADAGAFDPDMADIARSICDGTDDRLPSDDPRAGRVWPIGCTAWLIDDCNKCMITAGHCGPSSTSVIQFNVPLSTPSGTAVAPGPEDQYPVDPASTQSNGGQGVGNDWAYFGTFPNSNTQLTAYEAQGSVAFTLAPPQANTQTIRITGYGSTSSPINPQWNLIQKTHTGPYVGVIGTGLQYRPDTTGGNSGSPVIDEDNGTAIGVHTHAGCFNGGGANQGTIITFGPFQDALNNPQGICAGPQALALDGTVPQYLDTGVNSFTLNAGVGCATEPILSSGRMIISSSGGGMQTIPMTDQGGGVLTVDTPALDCGQTYSFYFAIDTTDGGTFTVPSGGAGNPFIRTAIDELVTITSADFNTDAGFSNDSTPSLISGAWERATPTGGGARQDPPTDFDGSGQCWLTQNGSGDTDVDGGDAILTSPAYDISGINAPQLSLAIWVGTNNPGDDDITLEVSDDNGGAWFVLEDFSGGTAGWETRSYDLQSFVALNDQFRFRIVADDDPNNSIVELGLDAVSIISVSCDPVTCPTDLDGSGTTDLQDLLQLLAAFGINADGDTNGDNMTDLDDLLAVLAEFGNDC